MSVKCNGVVEVHGDATSTLMERMHAVNRMVQEHAGYLLITSGEIPCPECNRGSLCYLVSANGRSIVECSTPGCLCWDMAPMIDA